MAIEAIFSSIVGGDALCHPAYALRLGRHRLRRVVSLAQTRVHTRPGLGFRPVNLDSAYASIIEVFSARANLAFLT